MAKAANLVDGLDGLARARARGDHRQRDSQVGVLTATELAHGTCRLHYA